jgi:hypothetical protein
MIVTSEFLDYHNREPVSLREIADRSEGGDCR